MKNIINVTRKTFRKILMRPMKTVPMPPCRNRRYFKTTVLEKDLHQLMMDLGFKETTGRANLLGTWVMVSFTQRVAWLAGSPPSLVGCMSHAIGTHPGVGDADPSPACREYWVWRRSMSGKMPRGCARRALGSWSMRMQG